MPRLQALFSFYSAAPVNLNPVKLRAMRVTVVRQASTKPNAVLLQAP